MSFQGNYLSGEIDRWARAAAQGLVPKNGMKTKKNIKIILVPRYVRTILRSAEKVLILQRFLLRSSIFSTQPC